VSHSLHSA